MTMLFCCLVGQCLICVYQLTTSLNLTAHRIKQTNAVILKIAVLKISFW